ncbi:MAG TPA: heparan-alpha-glucosaminide N-acetyltransferase domain-containing protein [Candidatus Binatia bacterium]|nr:heparan-alpha-glucosaminide N-acetyltransferase domain-containing protein [Candidatus Binatia bacterium]
MTTERNDAIDVLRGSVMILMALDHTRMFFGTEVDLQTAPPVLFLTRWITHFCAPVFVLLAGMAAYLHGRRHDSTRALSWYLLTRGLWLVLLEMTVVKAAWIFYLGPEIMVLQVIWAIGMSMVVLAGLVWLPRAVVALFAVVLVVGHNLLDAVPADAFGSLGWLWTLLHAPGRLAPFDGARWLVIYPLVPWIAVMAAGYLLGPWAARPRAERRARFLRTGALLLVGFVVLRATNLYGDPHPWTTASGPVRALLAFVDCQKYPPSLLFLAMTLGPALCVLAWLDRPLGRWARAVAVYGRVPLFYYVMHLLVLHLLAVALAWPESGVGAISRGFIVGESLAYPLPAIYALWLMVVLTLYPACRWFADVKRGSQSPWMSYL